MFDGPIASISADQFERLEKCGLNEIQLDNNLTNDEFQNFVQRSAALFPESKHILSIAKEFSSAGHPLIIMRFTKPLENFNLTNELAAIYFDRIMPFSQIKIAFDEMEELLGSSRVNKVFNVLLNSENMLVTANAADAIAYASSETGKLKTKALKTLISSARQRHMESLEVLTWQTSYFAELDVNLFYDLVRIHNPEKFNPITAGVVISEMRHLPYQSINKKWFQKIFIHAASGHPATSILARQMYQITEDERFDIKYESEVSSSESEFRKCSLDSQKEPFSCYSIYSKKTDDIKSFTYHLIPVPLVLQNFDISYQPKIGKNLIKLFFSKEISYELKSEFSEYFFIGISLTQKYLSNKTSRIFREIKADVNRFMWSNYAKEIVTNNGNAFPLTNEISSHNFLDLNLNFANGAKAYKTDNYLNEALPFIEQSSNADFLSDLSLLIYELYGSWTNEDLEDLIDLAAMRSKQILGEQSIEYFDFAYHKNLIVQATGTLDRIAFLIEHINEMNKAGLDAELFESELLSAYTRTGNPDFALKKLLEKLERIETQEKMLRFESEDKKNISHLTVDAARCSTVSDIRRVKEKIDGLRDLTDELKYCFNNFSYPSSVPVLLQQELFSEYMGLNLQEFGINNQELASKNATEYIRQLLEDQNIAPWQKVPFAVVAIKTIEDKRIQKAIWEKHFALSVLDNYPAVIEHAEFYFTWLREHTKSIVFGQTIAEVKSLVSLIEKGSVPDLQSSVVLLDSGAKSTLFTAKAAQELFNSIKPNMNDVQSLFISHQNLKFGPSEQLLLRGSLLSKNERSQLQVKLTKRSLTIEKMLQKKREGVESFELQKMLKAQNRELKSLSFPDFDWSNVYQRLEALQSTMEPSDLYLDFRHDKSGNALGLFQITNKVIEYYVIPQADKIAQISNIFRSKVSNGEQTFYQEGEELYLKIIKPYIKADTKRILISPHSFLFNIPFGALVIKSEAQEFKSISNKSQNRGIKLRSNASVIDSRNDFLGEFFEVILVSTIVKKKPKKKVGGYTFFGIGNPNFKGKKNTQEMAFNEYQNLPNRSGVNLSSLMALPNTQIEIENFAKLPIFTNSQLLMGGAATETALYGADKLKEASVISFATHGLMAGEINEYSEPGLALSQTEISDDGFLSLTDVLSLELNSELVILSACNTGSSLSLHSPPFSGLASAFLAAGSEMVMSTLWPVDDKATTIFINAIGNQKTKTNTWSEAHQHAISAFIKSNQDYAHPKFWAPFTIFKALDN